MRWALLLGVSLAWAGDTDTDVAGDADTDRHTDRAELLPQPLDGEAYAFCHEEGADADQLARWCALLDEAPAGTCPGMRATCEAGLFEAAPTGCAEEAFSQGSGVAGGPGDAESPWRRPQEGCPGLSCEGPSLGFAGVAARWAVAAAVAALLLLLARWLRGYLGWGTREPALAPRAALVVTAEPDAIEGDDDLPLLPEEALLARAQACLAAGQLGEAVVWARGAALRRLARRGVLTLHKARTDREYLGRVREDADVQEALGTVLRAVEDHRWAARVLSADLAAQAVAAAARILAALFLAWVLLSPGVAQASRRHAPDGDAALYAVVQAAGFTLADDVDALSKLDPSVGLVVLDLTALSPSAADWEALVKWVGEGGVLVLGGDPAPWRDLMGSAEPAFLDALGGAVRPQLGVPNTRSRGLARRQGVVAPVWPEEPGWQWCGARGERLVVVRPGGPEAPPLRCASPVYVQALAEGLGWVVSVADPAILRNAAMVVPANRTFLPDLLWAGHREGYWSLPRGTRVLMATRMLASPPTPVGSLAHARLLPFVVHLLVLWALLAAWRGWPLSPLRDEAEEGRLDFVEHARALGRHWKDHGATRHAGAAAVRRELARLGPVALRHTATQAGWTAERATAWVAHLETMAADPDGPGHPDDIPAVEALWNLTHTPRT